MKGGQVIISLKRFNELECAEQAIKEKGTCLTVFECSAQGVKTKRNIYVSNLDKQIKELIYEKTKQIVSLKKSLEIETEKRKPWYKKIF